MHPRVFPAIAVSLALSALAGGSAQAQQVYRSVGPDGRVTFSDRSPTDAAAQPAGARSTTTVEGGAPLPYELRQIAARFPVTLYTGSDCAPCASARNLLVSRGVPFTERTVNSNDDIDALKRLSGATSLPFGTIGGQQLSGFSDVEWTQYLDAAGYPKQSRLPAGYRQPAAAPLVAVQAPPPASRADAAAPPRARAASRPAAPAPANRASNPAGIVF